MTENVNNRKKQLNSSLQRYVGSDTETYQYEAEPSKFSMSYPANLNLLQVPKNTETNNSLKGKLKKPTTTTTTKMTTTPTAVKTKYDSHSEIFRSAYAKSNNEFDYPLLSCRSKYSSISTLNNPSKYLSNKNRMQTNHNNNSKSLKNVRSTGDPYHSLANEQLAKDYLNKNSMNKSDERAIERIITSLEKDMKSVNSIRNGADSQQTKSLHKGDLNIHGIVANHVNTSEENKVKRSNLFGSVPKW